MFQIRVEISFFFHFTLLMALFQNFFVVRCHRKLNITTFGLISRLKTAVSFFPNAHWACFAVLKTSKTDGSVELSKWRANTRSTQCMTTTEEENNLPLLENKTQRTTLRKRTKEEKVKQLHTMLRKSLGNSMAETETLATKTAFAYPVHSNHRNEWCASIKGKYSKNKIWRLVMCSESYQTESAQCAPARPRAHAKKTCKKLKALSAADSFYEKHRQRRHNEKKTWEDVERENEE